MGTQTSTIPDHRALLKSRQEKVAEERQKVWFPGINKMVEERVKSCLACQVATPEAAREPLQMSTLPDQAWDEISVDFAELSTGDYLLVVSDDYLRYPIVEVIRSVAAQAVIPKLQHIFSQFGIPGILKSDNGPPKITPYWPRANGEVERFMRTVKKIVKIALTQQKPWREELTNFLRNFRATPHSSTGKATFDTHLVTNCTLFSYLTKYSRHISRNCKPDTVLKCAQNTIKMRRKAPIDNGQFRKRPNSIALFRPQEPGTQELHKGPTIKSLTLFTPRETKALAESKVHQIS
ncbi:Transposon Ty3-I Gag-Pol poly, partial [Paramuricea clavata]